MLAPLILPQLRPLVALSVKATVPLNPFKALIVIVVVPDWPMVTAAGEVAEIPKSGPEVPNCTVYQFVASSWNW
jgi:hypothetical protein